MLARRVGKAGRKSEGRPPSPLSSISDKNKVNARRMVLPEGWLLQRRGQRGGGGGDGQGEGNDASQAGTYQSERGKAKRTTIDVTGHVEYNEDASRWSFPSHRSWVSQGDSERD